MAVVVELPVAHFSVCAGSRVYAAQGVEQVMVGGTGLPEVTIH